MLYSGKKFSELILEKGGQNFDFMSPEDAITAKIDNLQQAEFMGKPVGGKFTGYNEAGEPEFDLPGVTVYANKPSGPVLFKLSINDSSVVESIKKV
jgi:hypothetical protein